MGCAKLMVVWTLVLLLASSITLAKIPQTINYQGRLTDATGAVVDGAHLIKFKIYGSATGNDSLWSSGFQTVPVDSGFFEYRLGSGVPIPDTLFELSGPDTTRYLGITIGVDPEITPRVPLISVPYAYKALRADSASYAYEALNAIEAYSANDANTLGGQYPSYYLAWNNITGMPADIADGDDDSGGDITEVIAGSGLSGGGTTGSVSLYIGTGDINSDHIATDAITAAKIATDAVGSSEIATGSIYDSDINSSAYIATSKISGTAVNLSSTQTITGVKTFNDYVYFQDSGLTVGVNGVRIGSAGLVSANSLLLIERDYNRATTPSYAIDVDIYNDAISGSIYGIDCDVNNNTTSSGHRYGSRFWVGTDANTAGNSYGTMARSYGGTFCYGVIGSSSDGINNYGTYGSCNNSTGDYGAYSYGNFHSTGSNTKAAGGYRIDHPQDPENMYLSHSDVSSPDMMNIYNGNITTDGNGEAVVLLPGYFETLNDDYRYQLTVVGTFAQAIIAEKISGNRFVINTDKPFVEVSWQVTGVRQDAFAKGQSMVVESMKPADKQGRYQNPELFGYGIDKAIDYENLVLPEDRQFHEESER